LALGLGSLFNHSVRGQNVGWRRDLSNTCIIYTALRDIDVDEELCISYGSSLWFDDTEAVAASNHERGSDVTGTNGEEVSMNEEKEELAMLRLADMAGDMK
jgi:uncharacterized protein